MSEGLAELTTQALAEIGHGRKNIFYPVSRDRRLPLGFPEYSALEHLIPGENFQRLGIIAAPPLARLLFKARNAGFSPIVQRGFRSIAEQQVTFGYWVQQEMAGGANRKMAEAQASVYSARPGYSEHHLGTAVDLVVSPEGVEAQDIGGWARSNYRQDLYGWLREYAHQFGFVISYPSDERSPERAKPGSGYSWPEPGHLRFVGETLARFLTEQQYLDWSNHWTLDFLLKQIEPLHSPENIPHPK